MQTRIGRCRTSSLAALVALLQACSGPKSSSTGEPGGGPVPTNRMTIVITAESTDLRTTVVRANLNDGHALGVSYRLDGGDFLRACVNGACRSMADNDSVFTPDYIARFDYQSGVDHVVSFNRQQAPSAPDSRVVLPAAFSIVTPADRQQVTDGDAVLVSWAPTGAPARVALSFEAECTHVTGPNSFSSGRLSDDPDGDGRESVEIDSLVSAVRSSFASPIVRCSIDLIVRHELRGRIDPGFDGGTATGAVSREVNVDYIPR
jgi:hypothetical protein